MKRVYIIFLILASFCSIAHAEKFVCFDGAGNFQSKRQGDCLNLGICSGFNNQGLDPSCIIANDAEYNKASRFTERNLNTVVDMLQAEIDAILQAEADVQLQADRDRADKLDFTIEDVIIALVKRINTRIPNNPITKQEIVDQLKLDKGL